MDLGFLTGHPFRMDLHLMNQVHVPPVYTEERNPNMNNFTRNSLSAVLLALTFTSCNLFGQTPKPPTDTFPVIDTQNPTVNFLGEDNVAYPQQIDPLYFKAGDSVRAQWASGSLAEYADVALVKDDRTFTLNLTAAKVNALSYDFKLATLSKTNAPAYVLIYHSATQEIAWIDGDVHNLNRKYNRVMYATEDFTVTEQINTDSRFTDGITISVKLKKGFNKVFFQETRTRRLVTTSLNYTSPFFTSNLKN